MSERNANGDFIVPEVSIEELMSSVKCGSAMPKKYFEKESMAAAKRFFVAERSGQLLPPRDDEEWEDYDFLKNIANKLIANNTMRRLE